MNIPARHAFIIAASVAALSVQAAGGDEPRPRDAAPADPIVEKVIAANSEGILRVGPLKPGKYEFFDDFNQANSGTLVVE